MGTTIEDGTGLGYEAKVNSRHQLEINGDTQFEKARAAGDAYTWFAATMDIDTGDTMLIVRNDSTTRDLVIDHVVLYNGNVAATTYDLHIVKTAYTFAGTAVVGTNMNSRYADGGPATAYKDETASAQGTVIQDYITVGAATTYTIPVGIQLGGGHSFGIDQITESTAGGCKVVGYFVDR